MVNRESLIRAFEAHFGARPTVLVRAPGRVNLIGEHVDYVGGLVLPIAIHLAIYAVSAPRDNEMIVVHSVQKGEHVNINGRAISDAMTGWGAYVQGVVAELQRTGVPLYGADILIDGDLPIGAGLSSSAALEAAVALSIVHASGVSMEPDEIAECCLRAEREWANVPCGMMDQYACLLAKADHVMLIDCMEEESRHIPWPWSDAAILIVDSRSTHRLGASEYSQRVKECELALKPFDPVDPPRLFRTLRDVSISRLNEAAPLMEKTIFRRARHVITEIARVEQAVRALEAADIRAFGELMNESHRSLAQDYEVSSPKMDDLASTIRDVSGVYGARMTGGGFGGCVVAVAPRDAAAGIESAVRSNYDGKYGVTARIWSTLPCDGATLERLGA